jgi:hypothetical protein
MEEALLLRPHHFPVSLLQNRKKIVWDILRTCSSKDKTFGKNILRTSKAFAYLGL